MAWVVDTSVLLDIRLNDRLFGIASTHCLSRHRTDGLIVCPVSYVELAPSFRGVSATQQLFLREVGVQWTESWQWRDTQAAHLLWASHVAAKRAGTAQKRVVADLLIEAFSRRADTQSKRFHHGSNGGSALMDHAVRRISKDSSKIPQIPLAGPKRPDRLLAP